MEAGSWVVGYTVLFTGQTEINIDSKQRLAVPVRYRDQVTKGGGSGAWVCVPWPGRVLRLFPEEAFERLAAGDESLTPSLEQAQMEATFFGLAERIEPDSAGRLTLPRKHLELAGFAERAQVVVVGARNRLEVRDRGAWAASMPEKFAELPALAEKIEAKRRAAAPGTRGMA